MNSRQTEALEAIVIYVKKTFDIELIGEKLSQDESYRELVWSELTNLGDSELNRLISHFKQADQQAISEATTQTVISRRKFPIIFLVVTSLIILIATAWFLFSSELQVNRTTEDVSSVINSPTAVTEAPTEQHVEKEVSFRSLFSIHGSNTIGEKLAPALLNAYFEQEGAKEINWLKGDVATERSMRFDLSGEKVSIGLAAHGSSTAFKALNNEFAQIGMSSRKIKDQEVDLLKQQHGDLSKLGNEHIIALDGLAIIVNQNNPLKAITTETLAQIFSGEITNWSDIGGAHADIELFARDDNSGTYDTFKSLVLKKYGRNLSSKANRFESSSELSERVSQNEYAIGFIGLNYIRHSKALAIADSKHTKAIYPTRFTIATEDYPLARRLYLYTPTNSATQIKDFANFAISDQGQAIVQNLGLISQSIRVEDVSISTLAPEKYNQYAKLAKRLSLNFRFNYATRDLDNKGKRDLQRLVNFVEKNPNRKLVLMGFSDSIGARDKNSLLSLSRAKSVEQELNARGINVYAVEGFGENMPLANNDNEIGRERNRRVEVWVL